MSGRTLSPTIVTPPVDERRAERPLVAVGFMLAMTLCFSSLDASAKYTSQALPLWMVLWGRYIAHFCFSVFFLLKGRPRDLVYTRNIKLQVMRSVLIFSAGLTFWAALMYLPLAECTAIAFAAPMLATALSVIVLKERVGTRRWAVVAVGLLGVVIVVRPGTGLMHWASVLPFVSALFYAAFAVTTRVLGRRDSSLTTLFYSSSVGVVISSLAVLFSWQTPTAAEWMLLVWLGFIGALGHYFMIRAYSLAAVSLLAPFEYLILLWATILGFFCFGDLPDTWTVVGAGVIIISGIYLIRRERRPLPAPRPIPK